MYYIKMKLVRACSNLYSWYVRVLTGVCKNGAEISAGIYQAHNAVNQSSLVGGNSSTSYGIKCEK